MKQIGRKSSVGGDAIYLTVSRIVVSLIGLATSMLLARFRTLEEYGTYSQIIMVTDLVSTILILGLPNSVNYFLAKAETEEEKQRFMSIYVSLSTILTMVIAVCLLGAVPMIIRYFDNPAIMSFAYVFAIYPWSSLIINSLGSTCVVYGKANQLIFFNIAQATSTLFILLITKAVGMSFHQYMLFYMGATLVFALAALGWINKMVGTIRPLLSSKIIREVLTFSIPMGLASVVGTLNAELDKLVIGRFFTTEEYAIFANAAKELPVTMLATSLTAVLLPRMVLFLKEEQQEEAIAIWKHAANISFCFMFLVAGEFFVFAPDIMSIFYSQKYVTVGGVMVFRIYAVILIFRSIYWGVVLNATGKTKFIFASSILTLVFNLAFNVVFCMKLGFIGPAVATLIVTCIMNFTQLAFTAKIVRIPIVRLQPWKNLLVMASETIMLGVCFWVIRYSMFVRQTSVGQAVCSIMLGGIWATIYGVLNIRFIKGQWKQLNSYKAN